MSLADPLVWAVIATIVIYTALIFLPSSRASDYRRFRQHAGGHWELRMYQLGTSGDVSAYWDRYPSCMAHHRFDSQRGSVTCEDYPVKE